MAFLRNALRASSSVVCSTTRSDVRAAMAPKRAPSVLVQTSIRDEVRVGRRHCVVSMTTLKSIPERAGARTDRLPPRDPFGPMEEQERAEGEEEDHVQDDVFLLRQPPVCKRKTGRGKQPCRNGSPIEPEVVRPHRGVEGKPQNRRYDGPASHALTWV